MSTLQMILFGIRILKAIQDKDSALVESVVVPAIISELDGTDEEKQELGGLLGGVLKGLFK